MTETFTYNISVIKDVLKYKVVLKIKEVAPSGHVTYSIKFEEEWGKADGKK